MTSRRHVVPGTGALIHQALEDTHMTQARLAQITGVCQPSVSHWVNDRRAPSVADLLLIAAATGRHVSVLIPGPPPLPPVVFHVDGPLVCEVCGTGATVQMEWRPEGSAGPRVPPPRQGEPG